MEPLPAITLTGIDEGVAPWHACGLDAEIALLYRAGPDAPSPCPTTNRYPPEQWIGSLTAARSRCAVHVCGSAARRRLLRGELGGLIGLAERIQLNGALSVAEVEEACSMFPDRTIITQHHPANGALLGVRAPNHALLVDGSGGRGISPARWERPATAKPVGFAGGLGPGNLAAELPRIAAAAGGAWFWVDMEGRLRDGHDWFSLALARDCVRQFLAWREGEIANVAHGG